MRRLARLVLVAVLVLCAMPAAVAAEDVPRLSGPVTDLTGTLTGTSGTTTPAIERLKRDTNVDLWVLFVQTTGSASVTTFADQVARLNSLGVNDVLLLVAMSDRTDALWVSDGLPQITDAKIDQIISTRVEPRLAAGDPAGAIVGAATGLGEAMGVTVSAAPTVAPTAAAATPVVTSTSGAGTPAGTSGGGISILPILLVLVVIVVAFVAFRRLRGPRGAQAVATATGPSADLERRANTLLIETDDAVRDADQEAGFAEAQFGAGEAGPYRAAVTQASTELKAAFASRQQLDDSTPEDRAGRDRLLKEIVAHCERAKAVLTEQQARVAGLRDVEKVLPETLAALPGQVAAARTRLAAARTAVSGLSAYAPSSWQPVTGNVPEAEKRLDFADAAIGQATTALAAGDRGTAASDTRQVQTALAEAGTLFDAIDRLVASLADVRDRLPAELAAAQTGVDRARRAVAAQPANSEIAGPFADAERLLAAARTAAAGPAPDVATAFRQATEANAAADAVIATAGAEQDRVARRAAVLDAAMRAAGLSIGRASDFITTRRGGIDSPSRTRLAEAERQLQASRALATSQPDAALAAAQASERLADEALRLAGDEFARFERSVAPPVGAAAAAGAAASASADLGGAGWGGTGWGTPTPPGGFPGGVGSGWGGLGGRSRGGHW